MSFIVRVLLLPRSHSRARAASRTIRCLRAVGLRSCRPHEGDRSGRRLSCNCVHGKSGVRDCTSACPSFLSVKCDAVRTEFRAQDPVAIADPLNEHVDVDIMLTAQPTAKNICRVKRDIPRHDAAVVIVRVDAELVSRHRSTLPGSRRNLHRSGDTFVHATGVRAADPTFIVIPDLNRVSRHSGSDEAPTPTHTWDVDLTRDHTRVIHARPRVGVALGELLAGENLEFDHDLILPGSTSDFHCSSTHTALKGAT